MHMVLLRGGVYSERFSYTNNLHSPDGVIQLCNWIVIFVKMGIDGQAAVMIVGGLEVRHATGG